MLSNLIRRKPFRITRDKHAVFVQSYQPLEQWSKETTDAYLALLQENVKASVDSKIWNLVAIDNPSSNPGYLDYVQQVRTKLIDEFNLHGCEEEVIIANYHMGMLVISFPAEKPKTIPYYYRGVQLKAYQSDLN